MLFIATVIVTASASVRQVESNYENLKGLEWVKGNWRRAWTAKKDGPNEKKGGKASKEWRFAWTANKNAILISQVIAVKGKITGSMDALFGWDNRAHQITGAGFSSAGGAGKGWTIQTDNKSFTISAGSSDWVFTQKRKDAFVVTNPREVRLEYRRVKK